jgi:hypothetical protein
MAMRPTEGVFQLDGSGEVDGVDTAYASYTRSMKSSEARLFGLYYGDDRQAPQSVKVDNRPAARRTADRENIGIGTLGGHYVSSLKAGAGTADFLTWGAIQSGDFGNLKQRASAIAVEAGYQPKSSGLKPWFRTGYFRSSGDGNPNDGRHGTFFTALPTPRVYARTPFFNQMNNEDLFVMAILRPSPKLSLRADAHRLRLSNARDLWYSGGGAFSDNGFGYAGRPSGGSKKLGNLFDISADYNLSPTQSFGAYIGHVSGSDVARGIYANGSLTFAYLEMTQKF